VAEALSAAEAGRTDLADEIYVIGTGFEPWQLTCLRRAGKTYYDDGERFHAADPSALTRLTRH
jgi:hypothetical protein